MYFVVHLVALLKKGMRVMREHVLRVVRDYNVIINALLPDERRLFHQHIRHLDRKISPGINKHHWFANGIKDWFVRPSCAECAKVPD